MTIMLTVVIYASMFSITLLVVAFRLGEFIEIQAYNPFRPSRLRRFIHDLKHGLKCRVLSGEHR